MTTHPSVIAPDETVRRAAEIMRDRHVGMLPVIDNLQARNPLGVLTDRDIATRCVAPGHEGACRVRDHMTREAVVTVSVDADVDVVAQKMQLAHMRRILVVTAAGRLVGVIALSDIANRASAHSAELELAGQGPTGRF